MSLRFARGLIALCMLAGVTGCGAKPQAITPEQAIASKSDLWGEAALRQPGGPSYAYFERLLPPIRYVDADFHHYPLVLSAPGAKAKGRLLSNGSQINALARQPMWRNETGIPVHILVGQQREPFGEDLGRLTGPHYVDGYLPIVQLQYARAGGERYGEEAFAAVDPKLADAGAVLLKFTFPGANQGRIELRLETGYEVLLGAKAHVIRDGAGKLLAAFDDNWEYNNARGAITSKPEHAADAVVTIFTAPADPSVVGEKSDVEVFELQREKCIATWRDVLAGGTQIDVPEPVVNNAWRSLIIGTHAIVAGEQLNYSASNQYARQYANESGDSMRSLLLFGHRDVARSSLRPLFVYTRPEIKLHDGGFKLQNLADYFFQTRDAALVEELRLLWQHEIDQILDARKGQDGGLLPREKYCSDIATPVRSLNTNANAWRGLRDMSVVLAECGHADEAKKLAKIAAEYRPLILAALDKAIVRTLDPPFVPVALDGEEPPPMPITSTRMGSYWNLVIPAALWSGVFPIDSPPADAMIEYIRKNGGLCMGMTRVQSAPAGWMNVHNMDDLYGLRYQVALLRRDRPGDVDRALVGFYGKLAQGMTRDTFTDGEATGIVPVDSFGRQVGLPPNSTANASFLLQLRNLLVQDWDTDDDGRADSLRLAYATPRAWLADGKRIRIDRAPTQFGEVSFEICSMLSRGRVEADVSLPTDRAPREIRLRLRLPRGWSLRSARADGRALDVASDTIDLSGLRGRVHVVAMCERGSR